MVLYLQQIEEGKASIKHKNIQLWAQKTEYSVIQKGFEITAGVLYTIIKLWTRIFYDILPYAVDIQHLSYKIK